MRILEDESVRMIDRVSKQVTRWIKDVPKLPKYNVYNHESQREYPTDTRCFGCVICGKIKIGAGSIMFDSLVRPCVDLEVGKNSIIVGMDIGESTNNGRSYYRSHDRTIHVKIGDNCICYGLMLHASDYEMFDYTIEIKDGARVMGLELESHEGSSCTIGENSNIITSSISTGNYYTRQPWTRNNCSSLTIGSNLMMCNANIRTYRNTDVEIGNDAHVIDRGFIKRFSDSDTEYLTRECLVDRLRVTFKILARGHGCIGDGLRVFGSVTLAGRKVTVGNRVRLYGTNTDSSLCNTYGVVLKAGIMELGDESMVVPLKEDDWDSNYATIDLRQRSSIRLGERAMLLARGQGELTGSSGSLLIPDNSNNFD